MELKKFVLIPFSQYKSQLASSRPVSTVLYDSKLTNEEKTKILPTLDRKKRRAAAVVSTPTTTTTTVTASTVPASSSSSSTTKTIDRQKEAILLDVGGSETTQRRSASLYDKILSNPKKELTSEGTIKLENSDTDIPLSTFLYRLQNPFPKSSPVTRQFLDIVGNVKIPEHLIANQSLLKHQRSSQNKALPPPLGGSDDDADDDEEDFESVDEGAGSSSSSSRATSGKEKKGKEWYSVKGEKKQF